MRVFTLSRFECSYWARYADDGAGGSNTVRRYAFDTDGNRTLRVIDEGTAGEVSETSTLAMGSELSAITRTGASTSPDSYTYDDAGRMTQLVRSGITYDFTYGADDELVRVDRDGLLAFEATFDAEGRRITARNVGPIATTERRFLIAPSMATSYASPHLVTDELGAVMATYVFGGEHALLRIEGVAETYYLRDAIGTVLATVDGSGALVDAFDYDAFGNAAGAMALPGSSAGDFRFQGMWLDAGVLGELGAYFVRARMYDAATGRFTTRDAALGRMQTPESYWVYGFGNQNPAWWLDPSGRTALASLNTAVVVAFVLATIAVSIPLLKARSLRRSRNGCRQLDGSEGYDTGVETVDIFRRVAVSYERITRYFCRRNPVFDNGFPVFASLLIAFDDRRKPGHPPAAPLAFYLDRRRQVQSGEPGL